MLAVLRSDLDITMSDSTQKKARVLASIARDLDLPVAVHHCAQNSYWTICDLTPWSLAPWPALEDPALLRTPLGVDREAVADQRAEVGRGARGGARETRPPQATGVAASRRLSAGGHARRKRDPPIDPSAAGQWRLSTYAAFPILPGHVRTA